MRPSEKNAINIFKQHHGPLRTSEAVSLGIRPATLAALCKTGVIERVTWGLYRLTAENGSAHSDLVVVASKIPQATICLVSALAFHELTTQIPHAVDIAIAIHARRPTLDYPPLRVFFFSTPSLHAGMETYTIEERAVPIYNPEKSIADAFKYRDKIGLDVALEALKIYLRQRNAQVDKLLEYARICRGEKVMHAYLEALL